MSALDRREGGTEKEEQEEGQTARVRGISVVS